MTWDDVLQRLDSMEKRLEALEERNKSQKGTRLRNDFTVPPDWIRWGVEQGYGMDFLTTEASSFADYWTSLSGAKAVKLDWKRTWMRWVRTAAERKRIKPAEDQTLYGI